MKGVSLLILMASAVTCVNAQKLYFKGGLGYALPQSSQTLNVAGSFYSGTESSTNNTAATVDYNVKRISFSAGVQTTVGAGYMFSKYIGAELDANFNVSPSKYTATASKEYFSPIKEKTIIRQSAKMTTVLTPSIVLQTGERINGYARAGIVLPLSTTILIDGYMESTDATNLTVSSNYSQELKMNFGIGFSGAIGVRYPVSRYIDIWGEAAMQSMSLYAKSLTYTKKESGGRDLLADMKPTDKVIEYKSKYKADVTAGNNVMQTYSLPFSNFGINAGIIFKM